MHVGADHRTIEGERAVAVAAGDAPAVEDPERSGGALDARPSHVDLVALDGLTPSGRERSDVGDDAPAHAHRSLRSDERRRHRQESEPRRHGHRRLHAVGIFQRVAQHLIPAAEADQRRPRSYGGDQGVGDAALAEPRQIRHRALASRHDEQVGADEMGRRGGEPDVHARLAGQRLEVVEVRDPWRSHDHDGEALVAGWRRRVVEIE